MSDQPALDLLRLRFQVALQCKHVPPDAECLVRTQRGSRQGDRSVRQLEAITMPMQHMHLF